MTHRGPFQPPTFHDSVICSPAFPEELGCSTRPPHVPAAFHNRASPHSAFWGTGQVIYPEAQKLTSLTHKPEPEARPRRQVRPQPSETSPSWLCVRTAPSPGAAPAPDAARAPDPRGQDSLTSPHQRGTCGWMDGGPGVPWGWQLGWHWLLLRQAAVAAAGKWVGVFQSEGQIASFETWLGKPAQGGAGAAGAEFGPVASRRGTQACAETGAQAWCEAGGFASAAGPSPPPSPECSHLVVDACDGAAHTSAAGNTAGVARRKEPSTLLSPFLPRFTVLLAGCRALSSQPLSRTSWELVRGEGEVMGR